MPFMPFVELVGKVGTGVVPLQKAAICVNVGEVAGLTVIVIVAVVAHAPALGVKV